MFRRRLIFKEVSMKILKRIFAVIFIVLFVLVISYLVFTGGQVNA